VNSVVLGRWGLWVRLAAALVVGLSGVAFGQPSQISLEQTPIGVAVCSVFLTLTGPAAFIVGLLVLVVGGISIAVGGSRAIGPVVWGVVGVGIAISASNIAKAIFPQSITWCTTP
jgi:type IV secretory pathway VirB2 component (pilin)